MKNVYVVSYKESGEKEIIGVCTSIHNVMKQAGEYADEADLIILTKESAVKHDLSIDTVTEIETDLGVKIMVEAFELNAYPIEAIPA